MSNGGCIDFWALGLFAAIWAPIVSALIGTWIYRKHHGDERE